jgi:hypothetical protein
MAVESEFFPQRPSPHFLSGAFVLSDGVMLLSCVRHTVSKVRVDRGFLEMERGVCIIQASFKIVPIF